MRDHHEEAYYIYKPIGNPILLDFSHLQRDDDLYAILKETFGLPEYCGHNWDALWDCLQFRWTKDEQATVEIYGMMSLGKSWEEYCQAMFQVFRDIHRECPGVQFVIRS